MVQLEWYYDDESLNRILVRTTSIDKQTLLVANWIAAIGFTKLAAHHAHNAADPRPDSRISVSRGSVDSFANLDAETNAAAASIQKETRAFYPYAHSQGPVDHSQSKKKKKRKNGK